jgi:hypothetical protein
MEFPSKAIHGFDSFARRPAQPVSDVFSLGRAVFEGSYDGNLLDHAFIIADSATQGNRETCQRSFVAPACDA